MNVNRITRSALLVRVVGILLLGIASGFATAATLKCDVNNDGIIDSTDINRIVAARNTPASGPDDPRDADGNGVINALDVRACQLRCTRQACSTVNVPPVAHAGPDQTVAVGAVVTLNGSASTDIDGPQPLTFSWTLTQRPTGSAAVLSNPTSVTPTFTVDVAGTYKAQLVVNDSLANSAPDEVIVSTSNSRPIANAGPDQTKQVGQTVTLTGAGSTDPDGNALTFSWTLVGRPASSAAALSNPNTVSPTFVIDRPGSYTARLVVNDGFVDSLPDDVVITTTNTPPVANAGPNQSLFVGDTAFLNGTGSTDVDGDPLTYSWLLTITPPGSTAALNNPTSATPSFVIDRAGSYTAQLIVNDGTANSAPDTVVISTGNTAPVANPRASCASAPNTDCSVPIGTLVTLNGSASTDVDGNALTYAWSLTRPAGSSATLTTPTGVTATFTTDAPGDFVAQLIVNDGFVNSAAKTVKITSTNTRPVAVATAVPLSIPGVPQLVQLNGASSSDPEGQPLTYSWSLTAKPQGSSATLSSTTAVNPTFTADKLGTYTAQLIVNDGFLSSLPVTVTASTQNQAPTANAGPDQNVAPGATVQLSSAGSSDPEGSPLGFFWSFNLKPTGSTADFSNANAANPTFVADLKGTYIVQLIVNDGSLNSAPDTVQIIAGNRAPVANNDTYATGAGVTLTVDAATGVLANDTDADGDTLTATIVGTTPTGLTFNANGSFTYVPPNGVTGPVTFQYKANDGTADSNTATVTINVASNLPAVNVAVTDANEAGPVNGGFTFTRSGGNINQPLTITYTIGGTATNGTDYLTIGTSFTIPAGQSSATLAIDVLQDNVIEPTETVVLTFTGNGTSYNISPATATVNIADSPPVVTVTPLDADEAGPVNGGFKFDRTGGNINQPLTINYTIGGTATNGTDYLTIGTSFTIPAGQSSATLAIDVLQDNVIEPTETVALSFTGNGTSYNISPLTATVNITDSPPVVAVTTTNGSEAGPVNGGFKFDRTGGNINQPLTINYTIGGTATNGTDYLTIGTSFTIPAGQSSATLAIDVLQDNVIEPTETVVLSFTGNGTSYNISPLTATVNIADSPPSGIL